MGQLRGKKVGYLELLRDEFILLFSYINKFSIKERIN